jgi:hypothetical protein
VVVPRLLQSVGQQRSEYLYVFNVAGHAQLELGDHVSEPTLVVGDDGPLRWDRPDRDRRGLCHGSGRNRKEVGRACKLMQFKSRKIPIDHKDSGWIGDPSPCGLEGRPNFRSNGAGEQEMISCPQIGNDEGLKQEIYAFARFL